jgi:hypothetical protein
MKIKIYFWSNDLRRRSRGFSGHALPVYRGQTKCSLTMLDIWVPKDADFNADSYSGNLLFTHCEKGHARKCSSELTRIILLKIKKVSNIS